MKIRLLLFALLFGLVFLSGCIQTENFEENCIASGGALTTSLCCKSVQDFPDTCLIGACGCSPLESHEIKVCDCGEGMCFNGTNCIARVTNFKECADAGYPVLESYPRQCRTPEGRIFVEELPEEMSEELCKFSGGNWNNCSNTCMLDNQGNEEVACPAICEALCECAGFAGFSCPTGYECKFPEDVVDALGYCVPEGII